MRIATVSESIVNSFLNCPDFKKQAPHGELNSMQNVKKFVSYYIAKKRDFHEFSKRLLSCKFCCLRLRKSLGHLTSIFGGLSITSQSPLNTKQATKSLWRHQNQSALAKTWWGGTSGSLVRPWFIRLCKPPASPTTTWSLATGTSSVPWWQPPAAPPQNRLYRLKLHQRIRREDNLEVLKQIA